MKRLIALLSLGLLIAPSVNAATLYDFYSSRGQPMPSVATRKVIAESYGINNYIGTAEQNTMLLAYLDGQPIQFGGAAGGFPPSRFRTSLAQSLNNTMASSTSILLTSLTLPSGEVLSNSDVGDFTVYTINPGAGNEEKVVCGAISSTSTRVTDCRRGLSYKSTNSRTENVKSHSPGETVIISDDFQFFASEVPFLDVANTFNADQRISSSTSNIVRLYFGATSGYYLWHNTTTGAMGFASSSSEFQFNANGTTFGAVRPLLLTGGELKLATSTYDLELRDNLLGLTTSTVAGGTASGSALDDLWNSRFNATTTHPGSFTFGGNVTSTGHIAATEILQNNVSLLTLADGSNADSLHVHSNYNQLLTVTSSDYIYSNSASELTLYTTTLTGGTLDSNDVITFDVDFYNLDVDTVDNPQIDLRYGGSTILSLVIDNTDGSVDLTNGVGRAKLTMYNNNATNAQKTFGWFQASQTHFDASGASVGSGSVYATSSAAIDSTSNQTLSLIFKCQSANTACGFEGISVKANLERN